MKSTKNVFLSICLFLISITWAKLPELKESGKPFVILITSYNNEKFVEENLRSALTQNYLNYRVIFVNDCSTDRTMELANQTIDKLNAHGKITVVDNKERKFGLKNYYDAIHNLVNDHEIIVNLDGDDFLSNKNVLTILNNAYSNPKKEIWFTYGKFIGLHKEIVDWNIPIDKKFVVDNSYREIVALPSHLRSYYAWLFKRIKKEDFCYEGKFFEMAWDMAYIFPILEMSNGRFSLINRYLYIYNDGNPINDHKVNVELQRFFDRYIRGLPKYKPLLHGISSSCQTTSCILCNEALKNDVYDH